MGAACSAASVASARRRAHRPPTPDSPRDISLRTAMLRTTLTNLTNDHHATLLAAVLIQSNARRFLARRQARARRQAAVALLKRVRSRNARARARVAPHPEVVVSTNAHVTHAAVNGYKMGRLLGKGAYGSVFLATSPKGEKCAMKVVKREGTKLRKLLPRPPGSTPNRSADGSRVQSRRASISEKLAAAAPRIPEAESSSSARQPSALNPSAPTAAVLGPSRPDSSASSTPAAASTNASRADSLIEPPAVVAERENAIASEINIMKQLTHRHIVGLHEVIDDPSQNSVYFAMEYVNGGTLQAYIDARKSFDAVAARNYLRGIFLGLEHMHRCGASHRDVKPENVLIDRSTNEAKLCDLGTALLREHRRGTRLGTDYVHATGGTPAFFAPEMCVREKSLATSAGYSASAADWWALGVCAYMLVFGRRPHDAPTAAMLLDVIREQPVVIEEDQSIEIEVLILLRGLLHHNPAHRLTAASLRRDRFLTNNGAEALSTPEPIDGISHLREGLRFAISRLAIESSFVKQARKLSDASAASREDAPPESILTRLMSASGDGGDSECAMQSPAAMRPPPAS